jgi:phosphorylated adapter RNA export protein
MLDVEEGELVEDNHQNGVVAQHHNLTDSNNNNQKPKPKRKRKANKRKKKGLGSDSIDINRFVIETCRRLKEKKSYMVYTAVGCLGVSALSDLIKEVDAIQSCGGQMTADGKRFRSGGGVLWNIIKVREPNAYKEIMKKAREFEKQFRQPCFHQPPKQKKEDSSQGVPCIFSSGNQGNVSDNPSCAAQMQDQHKPLGSEEKHVSVHDRLRVPVSYDDDLLGASVDNDATLAP